MSVKREGIKILLKDPCTCTPPLVAEHGSEKCLLCTKAIAVGKNYKLKFQVAAEGDCKFHVKRFGYDLECNYCLSDVSKSTEVKTWGVPFYP